MDENENEPAALSPLLMAGGDDYAKSLSRAELEGLGVILPIATPSQLRQVFAEKQKLYAAILDESDYIYSVSYTENGRQRQQIYARKADAVKAASAYGTDVRASPKKSGIVKLAAALGIQSQRTAVRGLPDDPNARYSYVVYEATHARTGRKEEGVGWCDMSERGGRISVHDVIATADTRAYNRAVLRLAGFGDVSADEILGTNADGDTAAPNSQPSVVDVSPMRKPAALPPPNDDTVLTSSRAWAEAIADRPVEAPFAPQAAQTTKAARELRARARRGDERAAQELGVRGLQWEGPAQDDPASETFAVQAPPVTPADVSRARLPASTGAPGWNLSGEGADDAKPQNGAAKADKPAAEAKPADAKPAATAPQAAAPGGGQAALPPSPQAEPITQVQAKNLSEKLLKVLGTRERALEFLREQAGCARSVEVRSNQYEPMIRKLTEMEKGA